MHFPLFGYLLVHMKHPQSVVGSVNRHTKKMSFIPVVERATLGKRVHPISSKSSKELLYHNESLGSCRFHAGKRITGPQKPFHLNDELTSQHRNIFAVDNGDLPHPRRVAPTQVEPLEQPRRSKTVMEEKIEYAPLDSKNDASAKHFSTGRSNLSSFLGCDGVAPAHRGRCMAARKPDPPMECEVPGFHGMGNPFLVTPNERPNRAAAQRTNAVIGSSVPFLGERKNNIWSVYEE